MANTDTDVGISEPASLRAELKEWERAFAAANGGRKAGKEDIRKDEVIAAKYKAYNRLRSASSKPSSLKNAKGDVPGLPPTHHEERPKPSRKRRNSNLDESGYISTPRKALRYDFITPSKPAAQKGHPSRLDPYDSPSTLRKLFDPKNHQGDGYQSSSPLPLRAAIGPTPQRDGKALGLFDLLSASGGSRAADTPSARKSGVAPGGVAQTPTKRRDIGPADENDREETALARRYSLTPVSTGKKFMYSNFLATPITLRYSTIAEEEDGGGQSQRTALFSSQLDGTPKRKPSISGTPSFLRRTNPLSLSGLQNTRGAGSTSPIQVRMPQKLIGKGLSALVQGLRDIEDERMDDELDVLRELESEQMGNSRTKALVGDSQVFGESEQVPEGVDEASGIDDQNTQQPRKQWKKKGQKRTTRRVNMKPVRAKPKPEPKWKANVDDIQEEPEHEDSEEEQRVPETQQAATVIANTTTSDRQGADVNSDSEYGSISGLMSDLDNDDNDDDDDDDDYETSKPRRRKSQTTATIEVEAANDTDALNYKKANPDKKKKDEKEEKEKPKGRKVNPLAHANFRALKIRGKGAKGRGGGRFGRRR